MEDDQLQQNPAVGKQSCIYCGSQIEKDVRFCLHCGRPISVRDRYISGIRTFFEIASFIATAVAIILLALSTNYTREQLKMQKDAIDDEKRRSGLQDSLSRAHLELLSNQLEETRRTFELQERAINADSQKIREERRPFLEVSRINCNNGSIGDTLYLNLQNFGKGLASACSLHVIIRNINSGEIELDDAISQDNISSNFQKMLILPIQLNSLPKSYIIRTQLKYSWTDYNLKYASEKYFSLTCKADGSNCVCYAITSENARGIWKW